MRPAILICALFTVCCLDVSAQSAREILQESHDKCHAVRNGHYVLLNRMKYMTKKDTIVTTINCYFSKVENDEFFPALFSYKWFLRDTLRSREMYTGDALVVMTEKDSIAIVKTTTRWADLIKTTGDHQVYGPLVSKDGTPMLSCLGESGATISLIGDEIIGNRACRHIQVISHPENEADDILQIMQVTSDFWINKSDAIPVRYSESIDIAMGPDTMNQFEFYELKEYELNTEQDPALYTMASIPEYFEIKDYVPFERPDLLANGTLAPDWSLSALTGESLSLSDERGHLVLLDFFYKSCYPCLLALPVLQSLHEKYEDKGLRVIGINPFDSPTSDISTFMSNRGITYPVVLEAENVADAYQISSYPTLYLIDEKGNIIYSQSGYGKDMEEKLEGVIQNALKLK